MLKLFRISSLLEGLSYLVILGVTVQLIPREHVFTLGMIHGGLFMLYFVLSLVVSHQRGWPVWRWLLVFLAAIVPLAFIPVELFLQKEMRKAG
ncbi:MAG: DUF3817 domain-containing protein [Gammaproteobacteria bacterium]|nr:DUF3817 domain-containing protein [Gammaproteobacteria bacterium]